MSERPDRQAAVALVLAFPQKAAARPMKKHNNNKTKEKKRQICYLKKNQKKSREIEIWNSSIKKGINIWYLKLRFFVAPLTCRPVGHYSVAAFPSKKFDKKKTST